MSSIRRHWRLLSVAVCCVALGAGVSAIATAGAATSTTGTTGSSSHAAKGASSHAAKASKPAAGVRGLRRLTHAVQGSAVVHAKNGFATVTFQRGKVDSVNGQQLTITEGTPKATYKTVTVTIPANAVVRDDRHKAALSDVKAGQRVLVLQAPKRTYVIARTPRTP